MFAVKAKIWNRFKILACGLMLLVCFEVESNAQDLKGFLKSCAWGTVGGAVAGTVSLAFENKPSEHMNNIARGASLGLYAGILYGVADSSQVNRASEVSQSEEFKNSPQFGLVPDLTNSNLSFVYLSRF